MGVLIQAVVFLGAGFYGFLDRRETVIQNTLFGRERTTSRPVPPSFTADGARYRRRCADRPAEQCRGRFPVRA
jgi:hypothetical protein